MKINVNLFVASMVARLQVLALQLRKYAIPILSLALLMAIPQEALAQISLPFIDTIGCNVIKWMKGPLAVIIFIVVLVATLVVGMIMKMDWGRIITIAVIYGIVQGIITLLLSTGNISIPASCIV